MDSRVRIEAPTLSIVEVGNKTVEISGGLGAGTESSRLKGKEKIGEDSGSAGQEADVQGVVEDKSPGGTVGGRKKSVGKKRGGVKVDRNLFMQGVLSKRKCKF